MNALFRIRQFLSYQWEAKTKYYLHSPFVYQFYLNVLEGESDDHLSSIHLLREKLKNNSTPVEMEDYGTGVTSSLRQVSDLEKTVAVKEKYGLLLSRLVKHFQPKNILELGTSIGISSSYMALAKPDSTIVSLEGSAAITEFAKQNHASLGIKNIEIISGNFNETISSSLRKLSSVDLVFFDGNHRSDSTLQYFYQCLEHSHENSIFIFDDIYWSDDMAKAWQQIKQHPRITLSLDLFQFGICFFRKDKLAKENFVLRY
ncbi:MAG: class I SAM-dependent methyltransferase [Bacteroidota bacterium]